MQSARLAAATRLLAAGASGVLLAASQPPGGLAALVWVALAPLIVAARRAAGGREALRLGLFAGVVMMASGFPWFVYLVRTFAQLDLWLSLALFAVWCLWTAVPVALWAALVRLLRGRPWAALLGALTFPGIWWAWPAVFPFTIVLGLAAEPAWIQAAELGGVAAVEALALLVGGLVADAVDAGGWPARLRRLALALAVSGLAWGAGAARMRGLDAETVRTVRFGVVQPNIPLYWPDKQARLERLREPSAAAEAAGAEVVVWPENQYPWPLDRPLLRDFTDDDRVLRRHRLPTLFGAGSIADADAYGYNTAYHLGADGEVRGTFDKVYLVPIGETIPLLDPDWVTSRINGLSHNFAGAGPARFVVEPGPPGSGAPPVSVGPVICYEDVVAGFVRAVASQPGGVEVFVNLTNDSWFGPGSEAHEHLALAQFRSVEHRVPMVRSVNTGPSSLIDRSGRVVASTPLRPADVDALVPPEQLVVDVALGRDTASAPTVYARGGWLLVHLSQALAVGLTLVSWRARRRKSVEQ